MKICFIQPYDPRRRYYAVIPGVGLAVLAAVCERAGHEVLLVDALAHGMEPDAVAERVAAERPDVAGVTFYSPDHHAVRSIVNALGRLAPRPVIALGGPHPTFEPEETLRSMPDADVLFLAEAENSFPIFLDQLQKTARADHAALRTPGTAFRTRDQVQCAPPAPPVHARPQHTHTRSRIHNTGNGPASRQGHRRNPFHG